MDTDRHHIVFLDWLRFAACFLVMLIHACECIYSNDYSFAFPTETDRWSIACISGFARPAVPLFLMASAYLLVPVRQDLLGFFRRRRTGTLARLAMGGVVALEDLASELPAGPRLTCARAFTDNDKWIATGNPWANDRSRSFFGSGLSQLRYHPEPLVVSNNVVSSVVDVTGAKGCGFRHETTWTFLDDGSIEVWNRSTPYGKMPALARLGASCGPNPMWKYRFDPAKTVEWTYRISAVGGKSL